MSGWSPTRALELADRAQAVCAAQHGTGDRCCLMREVADFLREVAAAKPRSCSCEVSLGRPGGCEVCRAP